MNNIQKIILGLACMSFGSAYAFTATQSSCAPYINNSGSALTLNDAANIQACLQACPNIYGNGIDANTLQNIAQCKRNLSTLSFVNNASMQNMQSSNNNTGSNNFSAPPVQASVPAPSAPVSQAAPVTPAAPAITQNNSNKTNQQIKWF